MDEFIIINKTNLEKGIEVLSRLQGFEDEKSVLKLLLSQSTPLVPEIEKAYTHGGITMHDKCISHDWRGVYKQVYIDKFENYKKDYISNLTI